MQSITAAAPGRQTSVYILLVLCAFCWGSVFNLGKFVMANGTDPMAASNWRFMIASVLMVAALLIQQRPDWQGMRRNWLALLGMGLIGVVGYNFSLFYGLRTTSSVNAALIMALNPALTTVLSAFVVRQMPGAKQLAGILLGFIGVSIVVTGGSLQALLQLELSSGDGIILLGNLCWAMYGVIGKHAVKGMNVLQVTSASLVCGALFIVLTALAVDGPAAFAIPGHSSLLALLAMALLGTVLGSLFWNQGINRLGVVRTSVFFNLVPFFTMLIALFEGAPASGAQGLGAAFIIVGVLLSSGILTLKSKA